MERLSGVLSGGRESDQLGTDWRAFLIEENDYEPEVGDSRVVLFCPPCAEREFGPLGWEDPGEPPSVTA